MILELRDVSVRASRSVILSGISFGLEKGSFLSILGPNGAGKSTLLQAIPALIRFTGCIEVLGIKVQDAGGPGIYGLRQRLGYVPQLYSRPVSVLPLTVREVVELGRVGIRGMGRPLQTSDRAICEQAMEQTRIAHLAGRAFGVLSGGEQRKACLARSLAQEPELLLLDEPAGHLDFCGQEEITLLIERLWRERNLTIVMVTHDLRHIPAGATHAALLDQGRLLRIGPPRDVLRSDVLSELYGLPLCVVEANGRSLVVPEAIP